ncbi:HMG-box domain-containing protein [Kitasatospora purpeofusca]|uniref:HMG-box domain-containing protein n=1 Tax=Kitasatospora purpeofusca TaxID=67352 RepID=UPI00386A2681
MAEPTRTTRTAPAAPRRGTTGGARKKLSPFNKYMQQELARLRAAHPDMAHQERFKLASANWMSAKENPAHVAS